MAVKAGFGVPDETEGGSEEAEKEGGAGAFWLTVTQARRQRRKTEKNFLIIDLGPF
ncbi:MAG: hypothetical protein UC961_09830 [Emergencia sp.]|nr:hypothetical protein [Emergencia sp.]